MPLLTAGAFAWLAPAPFTGALAGEPDQMSACLHEPDLQKRIAACTAVIGATMDLRHLARALNARGLALCRLDRCQEAVGDFQKVTRLSPSVAGYFDNLARAYRAAGRFDAAVAAADHAIQKAPTYPFTYVGKARALEAGGHFDEALRALDRAIALAPADAGSWDYRGTLLGELKRYRDADAAFAKAFSLDPRRARIFVDRADVELSEGRLDAAIADLEKYPADGGDAAAVKTKLEALRATRDADLKNKVDQSAAVTSLDGTRSGSAAPRHSASYASSYEVPPRPAPPIGNSLDTAQGGERHDQRDAIVDDVAKLLDKIKPPKPVTKQRSGSEVKEARSSDDFSLEKITAPLDHDAPPRRQSSKPAADDAAVVAQLRACWRTDETINLKHRYVPEFRIRVDANGYFDEPPQLLNPTPDDPQATKLATTALAALMKCEPLVVPAVALDKTRLSMQRVIRFDPGELPDDKPEGASPINQDKSPKSSEQSSVDDPVPEPPSTEPPSKLSSDPELGGQERRRELSQAAEAESPGSEQALDCGSSTNLAILYRVLYRTYYGGFYDEEQRDGFYKEMRLSAVTTLDRREGYRSCQINESLGPEKYRRQHVVTYTVRASDDHTTQTVSEVQNGQMFFQP